MSTNKHTSPPTESGNIQQLASAYKESEQRFEMLLKYIPTGVVIHDASTKILLSNPEACRILGLTEEQMLGKEAIDPAWHFLREDSTPLPLAEYPVNLVNETKSTLKQYILGVKVSAEAKPNWVLVNAFPILDSKDHIQEVIVTFIDITEMRQAEGAIKESAAKYRTLFETMAQGVVYQDSDGRIISANPAAERHLGLTIDQMRGVTSIDPRWRAIKEDGRNYPGEKHPAMRALRSGKEIKNDIIGVFNPEKEVYVWLSVNATPQFKPGDLKPYQVYTTFDDITELKEKEEALSKTLGNLKRSNQELEQFAYAASHDLQEPLNTIINFTEIIRDQTELASSGQVALAFVQDATIRMKNLIEALLNYSRIRRTKLSWEEISCQGLFEHVLMDLQDAIERTGAIINLVYCESKFIGHQSLMEQLLQNLVANGLKFHKPGVPPKIDLSVQERPSHWEFAVADNGIGIEEKYFQEIFGIFRRLHTTDEYQGTGLGLALCRRIVELHDGKIWVTSQPNVGTTFYFTIPKRGLHHERSATHHAG